MVPDAATIAPRRHINPIMVRDRDLSRRFRRYTFLRPTRSPSGCWCFVEHGYRRLAPWIYLAIPGIILHTAAWGALLGVLSASGWSGASADEWALFALVLLATGALAGGPLLIGAWWSCTPRTVEIDPVRQRAYFVVGRAAANTGTQLHLHELHLSKCSLGFVTRVGVSDWWGAVLSGPGFVMLLGASKSEDQTDEYLASLPTEFRGLRPNPFDDIIVTATPY